MTAYKGMDLSEANEKCSARQRHTSARCETCDHEIIVHCDGCKIQVTGCWCRRFDLGEIDAIQFATIKLQAKRARKLRMSGRP
jgi:hypothetical protein